MTEMREFIHGKLVEVDPSLGDEAGDGEEPAEASDDFQPEPWVLAMTPEEVERAQTDGKFGEAMYQRWLATQHPETEDAGGTQDGVTLEWQPTPGVNVEAVRAVFAGTFPFYSLNDRDQAEVLRLRMATRVAEARERDRLGIRR